MTDAYGAVVVQLLQPLVKLLCVVSVWALQRALLWLLGRVALRGHLWALRIYMLANRGSDRDGLVRQYCIRFTCRDLKCTLCVDALSAGVQYYSVRGPRANAVQYTRLRAAHSHGVLDPCATVRSHCGRADAVPGRYGGHSSRAVPAAGGYGCVACVAAAAARACSGTRQVRAFA